MTGNGAMTCFEDARILSGDQLGIPVKCTKCGAEGIEWYMYSQVEIKKEKKTWTATY